MKILKFLMLISTVANCLQYEYEKVVEGDLIIENRTSCQITPLVNTQGSDKYLIANLLASNDDHKTERIHLKFSGASCSWAHENHCRFHIPIQVLCADHDNISYTESIEITAQGKAVQVIPHNSFVYSQTHLQIMGDDQLHEDNNLVNLLVLPITYG